MYREKNCWYVNDDSIYSDEYDSRCHCWKGAPWAGLRWFKEACIDDLTVVLARKAVVTLGPDNCGSIVPQIDCFDKLNFNFSGISSFLRMCWLKAIGGAWTTTCRMHEDIIWPCICGCIDCKDKSCIIYNALSFGNLAEKPFICLRTISPWCTDCASSIVLTISLSFLLIVTIFIMRYEMIRIA